MYILVNEDIKISKGKDDLHLEFQDNNFKKTVGKIAHDVLFNNDVYNFSFGCDYRGFL